MIIVKTKFKDLFLYKKNTFKDNRGYFRELFIEKLIKKKFPFDIMSYSKKNVLRGLHMQTKNPQEKIITVTHGKIFDVAVDIRKNSPTYGKWVGEILSNENHRSLYIPEGFAHGFSVLSEEADVFYKVNKEYSQETEAGIIWNDPTMNIPWSIKQPIISEKDNSLPLLKNIDANFTYDQ